MCGVILRRGGSVRVGEEPTDRQDRLLRALARRGLLPFPLTDELLAHCHATTAGGEAGEAGEEAPVAEIFARVRRERLRRAGLRVLVPTVLLERPYADATVRAAAARLLVPLVRGRVSAAGELLTGAGEVDRHGILPEAPPGPAGRHVLLRVRDDALEPLLVRADVVLVRVGAGPRVADGLVVERCGRGRAVVRWARSASEGAEARAPAGVVVGWCGAV